MIKINLTPDNVFKILLLNLFCALYPVGAQADDVVSQSRDTLMYRISLRDKAATTFRLSHPEEFLSEKALQRRERQHIVVDSTDLPVCRAYVNAIAEVGVKVVARGRWDNFVTVSCNDSSLIETIAMLPFVKHTEKVWVAPPASVKGVNFRRDSLVNNPTRFPDEYYGSAYRQIAVSDGNKLHEAGFNGRGMTIAVIDAGYHNVDLITAFSKTRILGYRDFVRPEADFFAESSHGTNVLSCMGMNQPEMMVGTAPEADYWLLRSEDEYSEHLVEQDYWCEAIEFADSVGCDVANTSLGYYSFDDKSKNYELSHLDGRYSLMSRQASRVADKGMILVCSAGNSGAGSWKKITPPGDAENVITVGAIDRNARLAPFSSIGNTADGRIKPDVVAVGLGASVMNTHGNQGKANGTSFASPIMCGMVTCLWQALPRFTAKEIIEIVRQSGDRARHPDNIYGYGVPNLWKAYQNHKSDK